MLINLILLFSGQTISRLGSSIFTTALTWWVINNESDKSQLGILLAFGLLPLLVFNLVGGYFVDKYNKKTILIVSDFVSGVVSIALGIISINGYNFIALLIGNMIITTGFAFLSPAIRSLTPEIVQKEALLKTNSTLNMLFEISKILGPILCGIIYKFFGAPAAFILNGISFFISSGSTYFMKIVIENKKKHLTSSIYKEILATIKYVKMNPVLISILIIPFASSILISSFEILVPIYIKQFTNNIEIYTRVISIQALGAVIGSFSYLKHKNTSNKLNRVIFHLGALGLILLLPLIPNINIIYLLSFLFGILYSGLIILYFSLLQEIIESVMIGKFFSFVFTISGVAMPIGKLISSFLAEINLKLSMPIIGLLVLVLLIFIYKKSYTHLV